MNDLKKFNNPPNLNLEEYDTDKISANYLDKYAPILEPWVGKEIKLLEIGILKGGSLKLWHDYFPSGKIVGIDLKLPENFEPTENIYMYKGSQADTKFLSEVSGKMAPEGFDIIIDDASHLGELTKISFWYLFYNHLKPGGLYVIEDWGTGYWEDCYDGRNLELNKYYVPTANIFDQFKKVSRALAKFIPSKSLRRRLRKPSAMPCHSYGMVGFIKQLVDEQAAHDVTKKSMGGKPQRESKFKKMIVTHGIVFIIKAE